MKCDKLLQLLLDQSVEFTKNNNWICLTPESILLTSFRIPLLRECFLECQISLKTAEKNLRQYMNENWSATENSYIPAEGLEKSSGLLMVLDEAEINSTGAGYKYIKTSIFMDQLCTNDSLFAACELINQGLNTVELRQSLGTIDSKKFDGAGLDKDWDPEKEENSSEKQNIFDPVEYLEQYVRDHNDDNEYELNELEEDQEYQQEKSDKSKAKKSILDKFARNLTLEAKNGQIGKIIGRDKEIQRTIEVLCRKTKNNPIHTGDAGVGKTAVTEGLALRIAEGNVPDQIKDFEIYSIEIGTIVAGTRYRGDFEDRLKKIIDAIQKKEKAILFIDEIHTLIGSGAGSSESLDGANILKPALSRGKMRCIGSTTFEEYSKHFEKDRAMARRFQKIVINEPTVSETIQILEGIKTEYENYHKVSYTSQSLKDCVELSVKYLTDKKLPDKAIDLMDEAGVWAKLNLPGMNTPLITSDIIKKIVSKNTGIPVEKMDSQEKSSLKELNSTLQKEIFGQDDAVKTVCNAVKKSRAGFRSMEKPEASFLFVGPTGVGKTELAKVLSATLNQKLIRIDMSEYQESYTISRLIGSAPGYIGYENGGILTEQVRQNPYSIILFDEIEKAHPDIYNTLLQVLDYGTLTDSKGRKADFRNSIIIFTSNAGARDINRNAVGFNTGTKNTNQNTATLKEAVKKTFTPEFLNRLDSIVYFNPVDEKISRQIAQKAVNKISSRLLPQKIELSLTEKALEYIASQGLSTEYGARNIERFAEEKIADPIVDEILFGKLENGGKVQFDIDHCTSQLFFTIG